MTEKATEMKLKVDLQCPCCYKMVKNILCEFPQIRDQVFDEKNNIVKITVVCCCPEKIRDKLCCKGGKVIKNIEIVLQTSCPPPPPPPPPCCKWPWPCYEGHSGVPCYCGPRPWPCYKGHSGRLCYCGPVPPPRCYDDCGCQYGCSYK